MAPLEQRLERDLLLATLVDIYKQGALFFLLFKEHVDVFRCALSPPTSIALLPRTKNAPEKLTAKMTCQRRLSGSSRNPGRVPTSSSSSTFSCTKHPDVQLAASVSISLFFTAC